MALSGGRLVRGAPAIVRAQAAVPALPYGVAAGIAAADRAVVWSRCDRPARMVVEYATTDRFTDVRRVIGPAALEGSDFTARTTLDRLPPGQHIFYRVTFEDLAELGSFSEPVQGVFRTPAAEAGASDLTLAWSADTVGQGWGINQEWGGLKLYETMLRAQPDVFINSGDTIYADQPVKAEVTLDDGTIWKNLVTEAKSRPAESVADFRGALPVQPARRAHAPVQRRGRADRAVGRPRGPRQLVPDPRSTAGEALSDRQYRAAGSPRPAGLSRVQPGPARRRRPRTDSKDRAARSARRGVRPGPSQLSRRQQPESSGADGA